MDKQTTWLDGYEVADALSIRPSRVAQICRCGMLPYQTAVGGILIHKKDVRGFELHFPELLEYFRAENEVDKVLESGELIFEVMSFPPPSTVKLLKCVERCQPDFPTSAYVPR